MTIHVSCRRPVQVGLTEQDQLSGHYDLPLFKVEDIVASIFYESILKCIQDQRGLYALSRDPIRGAGSHLYPRSMCRAEIRQL